MRACKRRHSRSPAQQKHTHEEQINAGTWASWPIRSRGGAFRVLTVIDEHAGESLAIETARPGRHYESFVSLQPLPQTEGLRDEL